MNDLYSVRRRHGYPARKTTSEATGHTPFPGQPLQWMERASASSAVPLPGCLVASPSGPANEGQEFVYSYRSIYDPKGVYQIGEDGRTVTRNDFEAMALGAVTAHFERLFHDAIAHGATAVVSDLEDAFVWPGSGEKVLVGFHAASRHVGVWHLTAPVLNLRHAVDRWGRGSYSYVADTLASNSDGAVLWDYSADASGFRRGYERLRRTGYPHQCWAMPDGQLRRQTQPADVVDEILFWAAEEDGIEPALFMPHKQPDAQPARTLQGLYEG